MDMVWTTRLWIKMATKPHSTIIQRVNGTRCARAAHMLACKAAF